MKPGPLSVLLLTVALALPVASAQILPGQNESATALALRRIAERYALTNARISTLLDRRRNPAPLPSSLPNPFYRPLELPPGETAPGEPAESTVLPAAPDESDLDTLARFAAALRISGLTILNGVTHLTINGTLCKMGDIIPIEIKGRTIYIQVTKITTDELTLGLNQERQVVRLRR